MSLKIISAAALALMVTACSSAPAPEASASDSESHMGDSRDNARRRPLTEAQTCDVIVQVARQVGDGPFDADVKSDGGVIDCQNEFKAAGLPIFAAGRMNDPRVNQAVQDRGYVFWAPQFTDDTIAVVKMDFVCRNLCGHGEELTIALQGGRWKVTNRRTTWMS